jgi:hypothetical protein
MRSERRSATYPPPTIWISTESQPHLPRTRRARARRPTRRWDGRDSADRPLLHQDRRILEAVRQELADLKARLVSSQFRPSRLNQILSWSYTFGALPIKAKIVSANANLTFAILDRHSWRYVPLADRHPRRPARRCLPGAVCQRALHNLDHCVWQRSVPSTAYAVGRPSRNTGRCLSRSQ